MMMMIMVMVVTKSDTRHRRTQVCTHNCSVIHKFHCLESKESWMGANSLCSHNSLSAKATYSTSTPHYKSDIDTWGHCIQYRKCTCLHPCMHRDQSKYYYRSM